IGAWRFNVTFDSPVIRLTVATALGTMSMPYDTVRVLGLFTICRTLSVLYAAVIHDDPSGVGPYTVRARTTLRSSRLSCGAGERRLLAAARFRPPFCVDAAMAALEPSRVVATKEPKIGPSCMASCYLSDWGVSGIRQ